MNKLYVFGDSYTTLNRCAEPIGVAEILKQIYNSAEHSKIKIEMAKKRLIRSIR
jgi:hypothetical protein